MQNLQFVRKCIKLVLEADIFNLFKKPKTNTVVTQSVTKLYIDCDTPDKVGYWKELSKWANSEMSRKWAFERLNMLMNRLVAVGPQNSHDFYVIQGAMAEVQNFIDMPNIVDARLREAAIAAGLVKEKEEESISEEFK
jgi:hypothetical protein